jgi:hypothetical protein
MKHMKEKAGDFLDRINKIYWIGDGSQNEPEGIIK